VVVKTIEKNRDVVGSHMAKTAADKLETLIGEVAHGYREIDFTGKPRL
jgi:hypothetical protein